MINTNTIIGALWFAVFAMGNAYAGSTTIGNFDREKNRSESIISTTLLSLHKYDSAILLIPNYKCLHVSPAQAASNSEWENCKVAPRFIGVPIQQRLKLQTNRISTRIMKDAVDSIGISQQAIAACSELRGIIAAFKSQDTVLLKFDACNEYVDYISKEKSLKSNLKPGSYDMLLKAIGINDHFWDNMKQE